MQSFAVRATAGALFLLFVILALRSHHDSHIKISPFGRSERGRSADVYNRTLGFQKVFAIGFSSRTDKRDALSLASSFSEFDLTWSEGVRFEDMPAKAIPGIFEHKPFPDIALGCWRAHLNVFQRMVNENIQTALIFEDDNDWDVNIKSQLEVFAKGVSAVQSDDPGIYPRGSPYGSSWDMLWLGYEHAGPRDDGATQKMYVITHDSTVPPVPLRSCWWRNKHIMPEIASNDTRVIFRTGYSIGMWGYAITLDAARKVLAILSVEGRKARPIDVALAELDVEGELKTYSPYPPLFSAHRFAGSMHRDSDIRNKPTDVWHEAHTYDIVYSTVLNLPRLVHGAKDVLSQWPNDTIPLRRLDEKYGDQVSGELRDVNLQAFREQKVPGVNAAGTLEPASYHSLLSSL